MTVERLVELFVLTTVFDSVTHNGATPSQFRFRNKMYDATAMAQRQEELIEDFLSPYETSEDGYVIEDTEKSE